MNLSFKTNNRAFLISSSVLLIIILGAIFFIPKSNWNNIFNLNKTASVYQGSIGIQADCGAHGATSTDGAYTLCTYTSITATDTFNVISGTGTVDVLVVAGGGGGGAGGGGGGGVISSSSYLVSTDSYSITVGAGGAGATGWGGGTNGGDSIFGVITALGGGGGGAGYSNGIDGGNGGGAGNYNTHTTRGGTGLSGYNGGDVLAEYSSSPYGSAGGGGAGEIGHDSTTENAPGAGGDGIQSDITGIATYYAGGGGGSAFGGDCSHANGGQGGGGTSVEGTPGDGTNGLGGGGGGGICGSGNAGNGGSGIVIVKFLSQSTYDIGTGLIAHYKMNDNSATTTITDNVSGNNGTAQQTADLLSTSSVSEGMGTALSFNGSSDYIDFGATSLFNNFYTGDASLSFWFKPEADNSALFAKMSDSSGLDPNLGWYLYFRNGDIHFGGIVDHGEENCNASFSLDTVYHVVISKNSTGAICYVNGSVSNEVSGSTPTDASDLSFWIGHGSNMSDPNQPTLFNGTMDDVRIYNRALNQADVLALYNNGNGTEEDIPLNSSDQTSHSGRRRTNVFSYQPSQNVGGDTDQSVIDTTNTQESQSSTTESTSTSPESSASKPTTETSSTTSQTLTPTPTFTKNLQLGDVGNDVKLLQIYLNNHGFTVSDTGPGSKGNETTFYGTKTTQAVKSFQEAHKDQILTPYHFTQGTGMFYDVTREFVNNNQ